MGGVAWPCRRASSSRSTRWSAVVLALVVIGAILKPDTFPTADNLRAILTQARVVGVLAIGMTFVIATAGIDLSVGSVIAGRRASPVGWSWTPAPWPSSLGAIGFGSASDSSTAPHRLRQGGAVRRHAGDARHSRGLALQMSDKSPISLLSSDGVRWFGTGEIVGVPVSIVIFPGIDGRRLDPAEPHPLRPPRGGGRWQPQAARIAGVPVRRVVFSVYCLSGLLAGWRRSCSPAAWLAPRRSPGELLELDAIGAVVIGGTSLPGGAPRSSARSWG